MMFISARRFSGMFCCEHDGSKSFIGPRLQSESSKNAIIGNNHRVRIRSQQTLSL